MKALPALVLVCLVGLSGCATQATPPDGETGVASRQALTEQSKGVNRGETEAYKAESAGKAYRAYMDSIGTNQGGTSTASPVSSQ